MLVPENTGFEPVILALLAPLCALDASKLRTILHQLMNQPAVRRLDYLDKKAMKVLNSSQAMVCYKRCI